MTEAQILKRIEELAATRGVKIALQGKGHYHLKGKLLVNYWPFSANRTAYVAGTTGSAKNVTPEQAIDMCFKVPKRYGRVDPRRGSSRKKRAALIKRGITKCHWCHKPLTLDTSTLEHIIPLHLGGLDNSNNRTLACKKCNSGRGHKMPELND